MASTTVKFTAIEDRLNKALMNVGAELDRSDTSMEDRTAFMKHLDRLTWISQLAAISVDGMIALDSGDMEAIWHWDGETQGEGERDSAAA